MMSVGVGREFNFLGQKVGANDATRPVADPCRQRTNAVYRASKRFDPHRSEAARAKLRADRFATMNADAACFCDLIFLLFHSETGFPHAEVVPAPPTEMK